MRGKEGMRRRKWGSRPVAAPQIKSFKERIGLGGLPGQTTLRFDNCSYMYTP